MVIVGGWSARGGDAAVGEFWSSGELGGVERELGGNGLRSGRIHRGGGVVGAVGEVTVGKMGWGWSFWGLEFTVILFVRIVVEAGA